MNRATAKRSLSRFMFRIARSDAIGPVVRFTFSHLSVLLPVRRFIDTLDIIGFAHPKPSWQTHILLVPKVAIPTLIDAYPRHVDVVTEVFRLAKGLGEEVYDGVGPMQLLVNGGRYQDVGQLHFHLICGPDVTPLRHASPISPTAEATVTRERHPRPERDVHYLLRLQVPKGTPREVFLPSKIHVRALIEEVRQASAEEGLVQKGFSLVATAEGQKLDYSCFHLVSGSRMA